MDNFAERTFFVTSVTWGRRSLFQSERAATLFLDTLFAYRERGIFQLYEFVVCVITFICCSPPNLRSHWSERCNSSKAAILIAS